MKKTITLLAAVSVVAGTSTTIVSCSLTNDKDKDSRNKPNTNKEVSQISLKNEIQAFLNDKQFDNKNAAINAVQNKKIEYLKD